MAVIAVEAPRGNGFARGVFYSAAGGMVTKARILIRTTWNRYVCAIVGHDPSAARTIIPHERRCRRCRRFYLIEAG